LPGRDSGAELLFAQPTEQPPIVAADDGDHLLYITDLIQTDDGRPVTIIGFSSHALGRLTDRYHIHSDAIGEQPGAAETVFCRVDDIRDLFPVIDNLLLQGYQVVRETLYRMLREQPQEDTGGEAPAPYDAQDRP
jgi:hypothetical protein